MPLCNRNISAFLFQCCILFGLPLLAFTVELNGLGTFFQYTGIKNSFRSLHRRLSSTSNYYMAEEVTEMKEELRKLVGSNCLYIERGSVTPYYDCEGCIVEEALGCVDDLRFNISGNIHPLCNMGSLNENRSIYCCPQFDYELVKHGRWPIDEVNFPGDVGRVENGKLGTRREDERKDLMIFGSGYPTALRCIESVGCKENLIYVELEDECKSYCGHLKDERDETEKICHVNFNTASTQTFGLGVVFSSILLTMLTTLTL